LGQIADALQYVLHEVAVQYRIRYRRRACERLVAPGDEFADKGAVRSCADEEEMARRIGTRVDGIAGRLECKHHAGAIVRCQRVLNLVDERWGCTSYRTIDAASCGRR
jgi:hypothetical protein